MFGTAIWEKLPECIFENFQKSRGWFIPKNRPNQTCDYWLITPKKRFVLKLISFNSGQIQIRQLQNNTINGAMSITINRVIIWEKKGFLFGFSSDSG